MFVLFEISHYSILNDSLTSTQCLMLSLCCCISPSNLTDERFPEVHLTNNAFLTATSKHPAKPEAASMSALNNGHQSLQISDKQQGTWRLTPIPNPYWWHCHLDSAIGWPETSSAGRRYVATYNSLADQCFTQRHLVTTCFWTTETEVQSHPQDRTQCPGDQTSYNFVRGDTVSRRYFSMCINWAADNVLCESWVNQTTSSCDSLCVTSAISTTLALFVEFYDKRYCPVLTTWTQWNEFVIMTKLGVKVFMSHSYCLMCHHLFVYSDIGCFLFSPWLSHVGEDYSD